MNKDISKYLQAYSENLSIVNKLIVGAYLQFNNIEVKSNRLILACIEGNDKKTVDEFINLILLKSEKFDLEDVIHLFEITIPQNDVAGNGAVYTPSYIKHFIVNEVIKNLETKAIYEPKVADISCGAGAFLYTIAQKLKETSNRTYFDVFRQNIFGLDISEYTIIRAKILLSLLAISNGEDIESFEFNLMVGNALSFEWHNKVENFIGFDSVLGNPPYVRAKNLSSETLALLSKWEVTKVGNPDLYIPFFEIGIELLNKSGVLGYITVNTFKKSVNARGLRDYFKTNKFGIKILDFGNAQVFDNKSTYTCIVFIEKHTHSNVKYQKVIKRDIHNNKLKEYTSISYDALDTKKGWLLNKSEILEIINKIEKTGIPLGDKFPIRNGLATLSNDVFIFKPVAEDDKFYYHQNGKLHKIEKAVCRDIIKPNRLKSESEIDDLKEQIIFPYHNENKRTVFNEDFFCKEYPNAYKYLLLNKDQLLRRDKGKPKKYQWFEFGRTQALSDLGKKLLFPYMAGKPYFVYSDEVNLLLYAGYAIYFDSERELKVLKRVLESSIFWYYITMTSKPYSGNYFALAKNYVKDFGVCDLSESEKDYLLETDSLEERNLFLLKKYGLNKKAIMI